MHRLLLLLLPLAVLAVPALARAQDAPAAPAPTAPAAPVVSAAAAADTSTVHDRGGLFGLGLVVTPKLGAALGGLSLGGLGATAAPSLEVGWLVPLPDPINRDLQLTIAGAWAAPSTARTESAADPRLADGSYSWELTAHQWALQTGLLYRVPVPVAWLRPTVSVALQTLYSRTVVTGESAGAAFPTTIEDAVDLGVVGGAGADFFVGPGAISAELMASWSPANRFILQETSMTSVGLLVGYRFFL